MAAISQTIFPKAFLGRRVLCLTKILPKCVPVGIGSGRYHQWRILFLLAGLVLLLLGYKYTQTPARLVDDNLTGTAIQHYTAEPKCQPVHNVYYVKEHKTGSSTFITVLYKYIRSHGLTMYPVVDTPYPATMEKYIFKPPPGREGMVFNMFGEHAKFVEESVVPIMPNGTHYVVSIRDPVTQLRSMMREFIWPKRMRFPQNEDPLKHLVNNLDQYPALEKIVENPMSQMLGYTSRDTEDIDQFVESTARRFTHVILMEHFDESMVLLKREFCWDFSDIIYVKLRSRSNAQKDEAIEQSLVDTHKSISPLDHRIYNMFLNTTLTKITRGKNFAEEVQVYRRILDDVATYCAQVMDNVKNLPDAITNVLRGKSRRRFDPHPWGNAFELSEKDCAIMNLRTRTHRKMLLLRQFPELCSGDFDIILPVGEHALRKRNLYDALTGPMEWKDNKTLIFSPEFCEQWDSETGFSLRIMHEKLAYMSLTG